jgi:hypothetical protein
MPRRKEPPVNDDTAGAEQIEVIAGAEELEVGVDHVRVRVLPGGRVDGANAAKFLNRAEKTLANWRTYGRGPAYHQIEGRVFYYLTDLQRIVSTSVRTDPTPFLPFGPRRHRRRSLPPPASATPPAPPQPAPSQPPCPKPAIATKLAPRRRGRPPKLAESAPAPRRRPAQQRAERPPP